MYPPGPLRDRLRTLLDPAPDFELPDDTAASAVLMPILAAGPELRVVFTKRSDQLSRHAGEISFPGGISDPGERPDQTALRETEEELGLAPQDVELLGALPTVYTRVTAMLIVPFVGMLWADPLFTPNAAEIERVLEYRLEDLYAAGAEADFEWAGNRFRTFVYDMNGSVIWGATARILWSFFELLDGRTPTPLEA
jgi:8-oxo-dGTP pyrophosphatase MutT (NUDIX family)